MQISEEKGAAERKRTGSIRENQREVRPVVWTC